MTKGAEECVVTVLSAKACCQDDASFLRAAFVPTDFLITKHGSENHLIKVPTAPPRLHASMMVVCVCE